jgi:hypothetical protein
VHSAAAYVEYWRTPCTGRVGLAGGLILAPKFLNSNFLREIQIFRFSAPDTNVFYSLLKNELYTSTRLDRLDHKMRLGGSAGIEKFLEKNDGCGVDVNWFWAVGDTGVGDAW